MCENGYWTLGFFDLLLVIGVRIIQSHTSLKKNAINAFLGVVFPYPLQKPMDSNN
jgi:hypothetical protein